MSDHNKDNNVKGLHQPIMVNESLKLLELKKGQIVVDCTVNRGGHSAFFIKEIGPEGKLIAIDLDSQALSEANKNLSEYKNVFFVNDNFANLKKILQDLKIEKVDVVYADLGVSSQELDISDRGFSFSRDEDLLMTFKEKNNLKEDDLTAKDIVNTWGEDTLSDIIYYFADEKYAKRIAKNIILYRKNKNIEKTFELVDIIKNSVPKSYTYQKIHFATRTFQALRMATNDELGNIKKLMLASKEVLNTNGKMALISFHSVEDRLIKNLGKELEFKPVNKKVITSSEEELKNNRRSRSAKLRVYTA
jgi:16S rRNA (cytosine1402-N4)-methyltransferase